MEEFQKNKFNKKLSGLVLPIAFQNFMTAAVGASDALMLGGVNQDSLSAVSLASQVYFILSLFFAAITIGTTILAAQYWGKGDRISVEKILGIVLSVSFLVSFLFFLVSVLLPDKIMILFTTDPSLVEKGVDYLKIVGISYLFSGISQVMLCIMKNSGKAVKSTIISSVSVTLNIILNYFFIFGIFGLPALGIAGAAIATVIFRALEMLWTVRESFRKDSIKMRIKYILHHDQALKSDILRYTMPVMGNELVWGCGFTMYSVIMGHLGSDAVAANSIANIVKNIVACVCLGIGSGGGIIVGNELGRGKLKIARQSGDYLCKVSMAAGIISGGLLLFISPFIVNFAGLSDISQGYLKGMLLMCSYYMIGKSVNSTVIAGIFCAGGDSKFGLICDAIVMWVIIIPLGLICAFYWKVPVWLVYFVLSLDEFIKLPAVYIHYKKYNWVKNVTRS